MTKTIKPIKKYCPTCRRVPLIRHKHFWACPDCGGELWDGSWIPGGEVKISIPELMQGSSLGSSIPVAKRRRSSRSGRRRKKPIKRLPVRHWLDNYY